MLSLSVGRSKRWQNWFWPEHCVKKEYCRQISPFGMGVSSGYCMQAFLWPLISNMSWWRSDQLLLLINLAQWHIPHPGMIFGSSWKFHFWLQWMWAEYFEKGLQNQVARTSFWAAEETCQQRHLRWVLWILWQCLKGIVFLLQFWSGDELWKAYGSLRDKEQSVMRMIISSSSGTFAVTQVNLPWNRRERNRYTLPLWPPTISQQWNCWEYIHDYCI